VQLHALQSSYAERAESASRCGRRTALAATTRIRDGVVVMEGEPNRFIHGHSGGRLGARMSARPASVPTDSSSLARLVEIMARLADASVRSPESLNAGEAARLFGFDESYFCRLCRHRRSCAWSYFVRQREKTPLFSCPTAAKT
jgi:hypothetical protein